MQWRTEPLTGRVHDRAIANEQVDNIHPALECGEMERRVRALSLRFTIGANLKKSLRGIFPAAESSVMQGSPTIVVRVIDVCAQTYQVVQSSRMTIGSGRQKSVISAVLSQRLIRSPLPDAVVVVRICCVSTNSFESLGCATDCYSCCRCAAEHIHWRRCLERRTSPPCFGPAVACQSCLRAGSRGAGAIDGFRSSGQRIPESDRWESTLPLSTCGNIFAAADEAVVSCQGRYKSTCKRRMRPGNAKEF